MGSLAPGSDTSGLNRFTGLSQCLEEVRFSNLVEANITRKGSPNQAKLTPQGVDKPILITTADKSAAPSRFLHELKLRGFSAHIISVKR